MGLKRYMASLASKRAKKIVTKSSQKLEEPIEKVVISDNDNGVDKVRFKNRVSKFCKYVTALVTLIILAIFVYLFYSSSGSYLSAWYMSITLAIFLLCLLSFPRNIWLTSESLELDCVLEVEAIKYEDIKRIYKLKRYRLSGVIPLFASYGFGGYYGYYLDLKQLKVIRLFATNTVSLVAIEDIYNDRYFVSCEEPDKLIKIVRNRISIKKAQADNTRQK